MKKKVILAILAIIAIGLIVTYPIIAPVKGTIPYTLQGKKYILLTAKTRQEWEKGLMYVRKLENADGMIFIFPDKEIRSFWNKNTYLNLDLYWIDDDKVIGKSLLPSVEKTGIITVSSSSPINKVIEIVR